MIRFILFVPYFLLRARVRTVIQGAVSVWTVIQGAGLLVMCEISYRVLEIWLIGYEVASTKKCVKPF